MIILYSLVATGCTQRANELKCPKTVYPKIVAIDKIKKDRSIVFKEDGSLSIEDGQKLGRMIKSFFIMQHYYFTSITDYTILTDKLTSSSINLK